MMAFAASGISLFVVIVVAWKSRTAASYNIEDAQVNDISDRIWKYPDRLNRLTRLSAYGDITQERWKDIANLPSLDFLNASGSSISDNDLLLLSKSKSLRSLVLYSTSISDASIRHLCSMQSLESINLGLTAVSESGLIELVRCKDLSEIKMQSLQISDRLACALRKGKKLRSILIRTELLTETGIRCLSQIASLRQLSLWGKYLSVVEIELFADLPQLESFGCNVEVDIPHMEALALLKGLRHLTISPPTSGSVDVTALSKLQGLNLLSTLTIQPYIFTREEMEYLRRSFPGVEIVSGD